MSLPDLVDVGQWWRFVPGADWRHPSGPASSIMGKDNHPVVDVAYEDALAYGRWAGRELPTQRNGIAARGGLDGATYAWVTSTTILSRAGRPTRGKACSRSATAATTAIMAPHRSAASSPMATACSTWPAMPGNTRATGGSRPPGHCCERAGRSARGARRTLWWRLHAFRRHQGRLMARAPNFCARYRPAARQPQELGLGASHLGFRTVLTGQRGATRPITAVARSYQPGRSEPPRGNG